MASAQYFDAIFDATHQRLAAFVADRYKLSAPDATRVAHDLLGCSIQPRFVRALFGVEDPSDEQPDEESFAAQLDLEPIRSAVASLLPSQA